MYCLHLTPSFEFLLSECLQAVCGGVWLFSLVIIVWNETVFNRPSGKIDEYTMAHSHNPIFSFLLLPFVFVNCLSRSFSLSGSICLQAVCSQSFVHCTDSAWFYVSLYSFFSFALFLLFWYFADSPHSFRLSQFWLGRHVICWILAVWEWVAWPAVGWGPLGGGRSATHSEDCGLGTIPQWQW